ncbi:MAG TPA: nitrate reductase molybdenum cofactor assembly chaperone [Bacillota bacterium]|nr:nitrate reductase molybdenum cofactor assembly chaperone [Bacillota bacterium]
MSISTTTPLEISDHQDVFQLLSLLLQYPDQEDFDWTALRDGVRQLSNFKISQPLELFLNYLEGQSPKNLGITYVNTFDFNPVTTFYLTYARYGEEKERGETLVQLKELYEEAGFALITEELPDYLPLILEFVSVAPLAVSCRILKDFQSDIDRLQKELAKSENPYAWVLEALQIEMNEYQIEMI